MSRSTKRTRTERIRQDTLTYAATKSLVEIYDMRNYDDSITLVQFVDICMLIPHMTMSAHRV